ncbi:PspC domain-containing protein [Xanthocytophaga agilis]|uniref:PspC domain-containing protein n=1 Tax=Xanthocytophaga agilis TaxID=3048010 RepID=A0AAE3UF87_9BACT|nr:PspC domain-containing protein [Xanthocytophaga agilis]MDJ1502156.1 PspC domain-containing protein [Xanthocytophaga agilis]
MKKTISINISGMIFYIEEDGYEKLKSYLSGVQRYFSNYEDGVEIISDIENRIAEIFSGKLNAGKQVITSEDVDNLIATMGNIPDFEAIADEELATTTTKTKQNNNAYNEAASLNNAKPKRLFRDLDRKVLGGVCSGIAAYFEIDPVWIRLLFVGTLLDLFFLPGSFSGTAFVAYVVLWIVVPGSRSLEESQPFKKLYRNPDNRTLGGVCSGLAAYFNTDVTIIRLLFVLAVLLFGTGILLYIVLWISMPEAKSLTEKMEMQGEPVTLTNIEANVKKNIQGDVNAPENTATKIILFPFRAIAAIFEALGKVLGPLAVFLVEAARIFAGLMVVIIAVSLLFAALIFLGIGIGWDAPDSIVVGSMPVAMFHNTFPFFGWLAAFAGMGIPAIFLGVIGLSLLSKRVVLNQPVGWTLFSLWILALLGVAFTVPRVINEFRREATFEKTTEYTVGDKGLFIDLNDVGDDWNQRARLEIEGFSGNEPKLEQKFEARGSSREDAQENAQMIDYNVVQRDTTLIFDSHFEYKKGAKFRHQELHMKLYVPYGKKFRMDPELENILENTLYRNGYNTSQMNGNIFQFTEREGLVCITCNQGKEFDNEEFYSNSTRRDYRDFKHLRIRGPFQVIVEQDDRYRVAIEGNDDDIDDVEFDKNGDELEITWRKPLFKWEEWNREEGPRLTIHITMPDAEGFDFSGATSFEVHNFDDLHDLDIDISAGARGEIDVDADELKVDVSSAGQLTLRGNTKDLNVDVTSAAQLSAFDLEAENADVNANSGASVELNVNQQLEANANSGGHIRYRGDARVNGKANSGGSIDKE